ncbi:MAG: FMN-binding glutamate synthase family protein [Myxococcaceae bacterium]|nr:FMN-binding glutamate synthase family protein [Myxococcaceae bacterium]
MRRLFVVVSAAVVVGLAAWSWFVPAAAWGFLLVGPLVLRGVQDMVQTRQAVRRNFPLLGNFRYLFETIRPEINQYFVESNTDGAPFNRDTRSLVYQRAKRESDTLPFGTKLDVNQVGYEWVNHSLAPTHVDPASLRITIGSPQCTQPYSASIFNVSAMSYGSLSKNAILALNGGARQGGFAHDTGEGGISPYHLEPGGDLIWEIGTGYFSARTLDGKFSPERFAENARRPQVKMTELKLSQGAKPGHGGILPAAKVTKEIAAIRGVPLGQDVLSPPAHTAFSTPIGMMEFLQKMRELSGGKPVGFKLCVGKRREFLALCKAMHVTGITPDFITVDGGEGGTGAAPLEFSNSVGSPLRESLIFVHNALTGFALRKQVKVLCSGRIVTGMDVVMRLATGADACNSARAMMMALGCIQALRCNTNHCPTGVATQDPSLVVGLDVGDKAVRVANYHRETVKSVAELIGAMGLTHTSALRPWHAMRRTSLNEIHHYGELYEFIEEGSLLGGKVPKGFARPLASAQPTTFASSDPERRSVLE